MKGAQMLFQNLNVRIPKETNLGVSSIISPLNGTQQDRSMFQLWNVTLVPKTRNSKGRGVSNTKVFKGDVKLNQNF